ncbi:hypothetical protein NDU88_005782, partial [Pleurodeles waltl]
AQEKRPYITCNTAKEKPCPQAETLLLVHLRTIANLELVRMAPKKVAPKKVASEKKQLSTSGV